MEEENINKHVVINKSSTLKLFNKAKAKVTNDHTELSRISDNDILQYILEGFLGEDNGRKGTTKRTNTKTTKPTA